MRYIVTMYMRYIEYIQSSFDKVGCREVMHTGLMSYFKTPLCFDIFCSDRMYHVIGN